ncbi:MAG: hypothetical protein PHO75_04040 [Candidatus Shapirobacteria bacterium]|nr:hypothetical protein [Candidatus Shapirobacteria bacterium]
MTPEKKSESIVNLPPKLKKAIAGGLITIGLATGCNVLVNASLPERPIITETSAPSKDPENTDPTQVATKLAPPGITETVINPPVNTHEPTATATEMPTPTEIPEKYPIDLEKLHNFPESYEYMVKNLDEFVEAPDPLEDLGAFREWVGKLEITIGDYNNREVNYLPESVGFYPKYYSADSFLSPNSLVGNPEIAYFKHGSEIFPMLGLNVYYKDGGFVRTMMVILYNGNGSPEGKGVIDTLGNGGRIRTIRIYNTKDPFYSQVVIEAYKKGLVPTRDELDYNQVVFGMGTIQTEEGFQKMINGN